MLNSGVGNLKINRNSGLQCLMYFAFHIANKYAVDDIAQKMGIHPDTLYKWINGTHIFPAEQIVGLTQATGDLAYLEHLADKCGCSLIPKIRDKKIADTMKAMAHLLTSATHDMTEGKS